MNLGEREIIDILAGKDRDIDDCAVLKCGDMDLLLSTDLITRATHLPDGTPPFLAGKFFAALNLSDIAAMAGIPEGMLISISVSPEYDIQYMEEFYHGARYELSRYGATILGGDTKEGNDFTASGTIGDIKDSENLNIRNRGREIEILKTLSRDPFQESVLNIL